MELTKKSAKVEAPQAIFKAGDWEWRVLKTYQNDDSKPFARWFVAVKSPHTFGSFDIGDTYVRDIIVEARAGLVEVDGREPTSADHIQVRNLITAIVKTSPKDPLAAYGF